MIIKGLEFIQTCGSCPEQYDVKDRDGNQVGYVRLRYGMLYSEYPDCGGEVIYRAPIGDSYCGSFNDESERLIHLNRIADKLLKKLKTH